MNLIETVNELQDDAFFDAEKAPNSPMGKTSILHYVSELETIIPDLKQRPGFIDPKPGEVIPSDAVILVTSYPFGKHRCLRALWIEDNGKKGQRDVYATSAFLGKRTSWNKPKASTYFVGRVGFFTFNEYNHVVVSTYDYMNNGIKGGYSSPYQYFPENIQQFLDTHVESLSEKTKQFLRGYIEYLTKKKNLQTETV